MGMRARLRLLLLALVFALPAHAQSWPQKGLRIIVPFPAGGAEEEIRWRGVIKSANVTLE